MPKHHRRSSSSDSCECRERKNSNNQRICGTVNLATTSAVQLSNISGITPVFQTTLAFGTLSGSGLIGFTNSKAGFIQIFYQLNFSVIVPIGTGNCNVQFETIVVSNLTGPVPGTTATEFVVIPQDPNINVIIG